MDKSASDYSNGRRWSDCSAWAWVRAQPWLFGFNYVPSTAVNTTEMWQRETFDPDTIERELGWAHSIGFNTCRVFLQYLVWEGDPEGLLARLGVFIGIASRRSILPMVCLFDDCAFSGRQPYLGPQDAPVPGVHNSGWTPSPGHERVVDRAAWPRLRGYAAAVVSRFARDDRLLAWDLYNEPGNSGMKERSLPLLREVFGWAREAGAQQPLTVGVWSEDSASIADTSATLSDVISFHCYGDRAAVEEYVARLEQLGRPILCTEWMARTLGSRFETHLPFFRHAGIGCYSWGLVGGKTQTRFPWGSPQDGPEPALWFHDILHPDGTPYIEEEIRLIRRCCNGGRTS